jgi:Trypsin-like peptidase domain
MPRIVDSLPFAVAYLYDSAAAAQQGERTGGSGFLVGQPATLQPDLVVVYIVTNRHVVDGGAIVARYMHATGERHIDGQATTESWFSALSDDIAIRRVGYAFAHDTDQAVKFVPREWFITPDNLTTCNRGDGPEPRYLPFGIGDDTFMLGRFIGFDGGEQNQPSARFGNLSVAVPTRIKSRTGGEHESFIVEARSLAGFSGSPVFIYRANSSFFGNPLALEQVTLLGVDWGHLRAGEQTEYVVDSASDEGMKDRYSSGMMVVVPAWKLAELLDTEDVVDDRDNYEREVIKNAEAD